MSPRPAPSLPDHAASSCVDDVLQGFSPTCPGCLVPLHPYTVGAAAAWRCDDCGLVVLA